MCRDLHGHHTWSGGGVTCSHTFKQRGINKVFAVAKHVRRQKHGILDPLRRQIEVVNGCMVMAHTGLAAAHNSAKKCR